MIERREENEEKIVGKKTIKILILRIVNFCKLLHCEIFHFFSLIIFYALTKIKYMYSYLHCLHSFWIVFTVVEPPPPKKKIK